VRPVTMFVPLPPTYRGGTEEYAYQVAGAVSRRHPVRLLTTRVREGAAAQGVPTGEAQIERLEAFELWERPVVHGKASREAIRRAVEDSSVLHLHMPFPLVEKRLTRLAAAAGVPTVLTYHMDAQFGFPGLRGPMNAAYRRLSAHPALDAASVAVSNSRGYAEASPVLSRHLAKVRVIHKGIDPKRLGLDGNGSAAGVVPAPKVWGEAGGLRILFVGRLVPYKGLPVLIEGFARYRSAGGRGTLFIAGTGPEEGRARREVGRLGLDAQVHLLGFVPDAALGRLYREADLVACTSVNSLESTPTSLEEAAAFGTPVLGPALPGAAETIPSDGRRGALVRPYDVDGVAREMTRLLSSAFRANPGTPRSWTDVADEYLALFAELGGGRWGA
jgi:glycosyltransferase involved in cell wall biosynthesis